MATTRVFLTAVQPGDTSLTTDDVGKFVASDPEDDEELPLGDALAAVAVAVGGDSVRAVRDVRKRF